MHAYNKLWQEEQRPTLPRHLSLFFLSTSTLYFVLTLFSVTHAQPDACPSTILANASTTPPTGLAMVYPPEQQFAYFISSGHDINGDAYFDVVVGSLLGDFNPGTVAASVVYGGPDLEADNPEPMDLTTLNGTDGVNVLSAIAIANPVSPGTLSN